MAYFDDSTLYPNKERTKLQRQELIKEDRNALKGLKYKARNAVDTLINDIILDNTSSLNGSVLYDYNSPKTQEKQNIKMADSINREMQKNNLINNFIEQENKNTLNQNQLAKQNAVNNAINEALPPLPKASPTSALKTNFNPNNIPTIKINPDGTVQEVPQNTNTPEQASQINKPVEAVEEAIPQLNEFVKDDKRSAFINSLARGMNNFQNGFVENRYNSFNPSNLTNNKFKVGENKEQNKGIMGRVGEALGTARRALDKPVVQGIANGLAMGLMSANPMIGLISGINSANNASKSQIYSKALRDFGIDVQDSPFAVTDKTDFETLTKPIIEQQKQEANFKQEQLKHNNNLILQQNEQAIKQYQEQMKNIKDGKSREKVKMVLEMLADPNLSTEEKDMAFRELYAETGIDAYKDFEKYLKAVSENSALESLGL